MSDKYEYVWERTYKAVTTLAEHPGPIRERLAAAAEDLSTLKLDEFPPDARSRIAELRRLLHAVLDPQRGTYGASADALTDDQADKLAKWIVEVYLRVHELHPDADIGPLDSIRV